MSPIRTRPKLSSVAEVFILRLHAISEQLCKPCNGVESWLFQISCLRGLYSEVSSHTDYREALPQLLWALAFDVHSWAGSGFSCRFFSTEAPREMTAHGMLCK